MSEVYNTATKNSTSKISPDENFSEETYFQVEEESEDTKGQWILNSLARNGNITPACLGFLVYLFSHDPSFKISLQAVKNHYSGLKVERGKSRDFILKLVKEAEENGYISKQYFSVKGLKRFRYVLHKKPLIKKMFAATGSTVPGSSSPLSITTRKVKKEKVVVEEKESPILLKETTTVFSPQKERIAKIEGNTGEKPVSIKDFGGGSNLTRGGWVKNDPPYIERSDDIDISIKRSSIGGMGGKPPKPEKPPSSAISPPPSATTSLQKMKKEGKAASKKKPPYTFDITDDEIKHLKLKYPPDIVSKKVLNLKKTIEKYPNAYSPSDARRVLVEWLNEAIAKRANTFSGKKDGFAGKTSASDMAAIDKNKKYIEKLLSDNPELGNQIEIYPMFVMISKWSCASEPPHINFLDPRFHEKFAEWTKKYGVRYNL